MPDAGEAAEPLHVTMAFERDAAGAARETQVAAILNAAEAGAASGRMDALARAAHAASAARYATADEDMRDALGDAWCMRLARVAEAPSRCWDDLAIKLAVLVRLQCEIGRGEADETGRLEAGLSASALADAVLLRAGPIVLPPGSIEPAATPEAIAHWRRVAAAAVQGD